MNSHFYLGYLRIFEPDMACFEVPAASVEPLLHSTGSASFSEALDKLRERLQEIQNRTRVIAAAELSGVGFVSVHMRYDSDCINFFIDHYNSATGLLHLSRFDDSSIVMFVSLDLRLPLKIDLKYNVVIRVKPAFFILDGVKRAIADDVRFVDVSEDRKIYDVVHELSVLPEAQKLPLLSLAARHYEIVPINAETMWWDADGFEAERLRGVIRYYIIPEIERGNCQREVKVK